MKLLKCFISLILTFGIIIPNCGMVFAGGMESMNHDEISLMQSNQKTIHLKDVSLLNENCCACEHGSNIDRDFALTKPSQDCQKTTSSLVSGNFGVIEYSKKKDLTIRYRTHTPPDPSEYSSLIGVSQKNLN